MLSVKKLLAGGTAGLLIGTRTGRAKLSTIAGFVKQRVGACKSSPDTGSAAPALPTSTAEEVFGAEHPTPGTVAAAVGAPNAPDLDAIADRTEARTNSPER